MRDLLILALIGALLVNLLVWCFRHLPQERWQMLAVVPHRKSDSNHWQGINLTYYGFFIANSQTLAIMLLIVLLGTMHVSLAGTLLATAMLLAICLPAARMVARLVEKKRHTFTIGGASFVGTLCAPLCITCAQWLLDGQAGGRVLPILPVLAAMAIAYTLGEGLGRLACISYGCCYGKPVKNCGPIVRRLFARTGFIFSGPFKKAAYESGLQNERLVPIQAITCMFYTLTALLGCMLFLHRHFTPALLFCMTVTQVWRLLSEMLRADFRGLGTLSAYQKMGILSLVYTIALSFFLPQAMTSAQPALLDGLSSLWHPGIILGLQFAWLVFFLYFGRSTVTTASVSFGLAKGRI